MGRTSFPGPSRRIGGRPVRSVLLAVVLTVLGVACAAPQPQSGVAPVGSTSGAGGVLWSGDLETDDLSQFQHAPWNLVGGLPPAIVTDPVRDGRFALALGIPGRTTPDAGICCGSRNEVLPTFRDLVPGDDLYFGFSSYLEPGFPVDADWQLITQFKQNFDGSPPLGLYVEQGQYRMEGGYGHPAGPRPFNLPIGAAVPGRWEDWVLHVVFSADPTVGHVEVWKDGALVLPRYAPVTGTMYPRPDGVDGSYLKIGYYRNPDIAQAGTVVYDDWRIGTSLDAVRTRKA